MKIGSNDKSKSLSVRARLLKALGEELITSDVVAIIELVKNSYDADAENVLIKFRNIDDESGSIVELFDDGHGMSLADIHGKWMEIATGSKRSESRSEGKDRRYLGAKGIGRFATSRLAKQLELISREIESETESYSIFDWTQFDDDSLYIEDVVFLAEERRPEEIGDHWHVPVESKKTGTDSSGMPKGHGTVLRMTGLKRNWEKKDFMDLQRSLSRLVSPYSGLQDFSIFLDVPKEFDFGSEQIGYPEILDYPHYRCAGRVSDDGAFTLNIWVGESEIFESRSGFFYLEKNYGVWTLVDSHEPPDREDMKKGISRRIQSGPFEFDLKFWDRDELSSVEQKLDLKVGVRALRQDLNHICGINIYRDGFRVLPYGEPSNDWLRLDVRRVQKPTARFSNNQIFGHISISADTNPELRDSSNREGLDDTEGFQNFRDMIVKMLGRVENVRYGLRRRKKKPHGKGEAETKKNIFESPDFSRVKKKLGADDFSSEEIEAELEKLEHLWHWQLTELKEKVSQYHSLASLGAIADKIVHDGGNPLSRIVTDADLGLLAQSRFMRENPELSAGDISDNAKRFEEILDNSSQVRAVFRHIEPFGGRKRGRPKKLYAEPIIKSVFDFYENEIKSSGINVRLPENESLVSLDEAELRQVVQNLLQNSLFWLKKVSRDQRGVVVETRHQPGEFFELIFADSGPGVDPEDRERIFLPYVSGREDGSGMGLAIIGEIIRDYYQGTLELLENKASRGAVFRAVFKQRV